ncbi:MAG TPA: NUDIX hydrolase [Acholeplasmataceae bacterium]|jgi:ADP-ribose pyrophosphatase|nr:NUDIX hydrolase [Acholeplasmataceae bacterium]
MEEQPKTLTSKRVYTGKIINLRRDEIMIAGQSAVREIVEHPGGAAVLAARDGHIYLVRQYRHPYHREILEVPAGKIEPGEEPGQTVARELTEETGIKAKSLEAAGKLYPSPGYTDEVIHLFFTDDFTVSSGRHLDADEDVALVCLPVTKVYRMVDAGEITDAKTLVLLYKYRERLLTKGR